VAVDVFGLALAPWFLRAICSIPSFGIAEFAVNVCSSDTNENTNKTDGCRELFRVFSMRRENIPENQKSNQCFKLLLLLMFSIWGPWPIAAYYHNHLNVKIFLSSIVADTNRNTNKVDARY
jgi:hypothetical protein